MSTDHGGTTRRGFLVTGGAAVVAKSVPFGSAAAREAAGQVETIAVEMEVNGSDRWLELDPRATLLDTLRERIGLLGTKKGCDHGQCGACTVHIDGRRVVSCLTLAVQMQGKKIPPSKEWPRPTASCIRCNRRFLITMACNVGTARPVKSWRR